MSAVISRYCGSVILSFCGRFTHSCAPTSARMLWHLHEGCRFRQSSTGILPHRLNPCCRDCPHDPSFPLSDMSQSQYLCVGATGNPLCNLEDHMSRRHPTIGGIKITYIVESKYPHQTYSRTTTLTTTTNYFLNFSYFHFCDLNIKINPLQVSTLLILQKLI